MIRKLRKTDLDEVAYIWSNTNKKAHDFIAETYWDEHFEMVKGMLGDAEIYVFEEKSHKEIADKLGISESTSFSQYHRAKKLLAKQIKDYSNNEK